MYHFCIKGTHYQILGNLGFFPLEFKLPIFHMRHSFVFFSLPQSLQPISPPPHAFCPTCTEQTRRESIHTYQHKLCFWEKVGSYPIYKYVMCSFHLTVSTDMFPYQHTHSYFHFYTCYSPLFGLP